MEYKLYSGSLITIEYEPDKKRVMEFNTLVEANHNDETFLILAPMHHGHPYLFKESDRISVIFSFINSDQRYETYSFEAIPVERVRKDNLAYLKIKRISPIKKKQRRDFFRLEYVEELVLKMENKSEEGDAIVVLSKDISAGGVRVISPEKLKLKTKCILCLDMDGEVFEMKGTVIQCEKVIDSVKKYDIRIKFERNLNQDINRLLKYLLAIQAEHIRKMSRANDEERLNLGYSSSLFHERRIQQDWILQWLDFSVVITWFMTLIISVNFLLAKPPWKFGIQKFWGSVVRTEWDVELLIRNLYLFTAMLLISGFSLFLNSFRMKRTGDRYRMTLIIAGIVSLVALLIYVASYQVLFGTA